MSGGGQVGLLGGFLGGRFGGRKRGFNGAFGFLDDSLGIRKRGLALAQVRGPIGLGGRDTRGYKLLVGLDELAQKPLNLGLRFRRRPGRRR